MLVRGRYERAAREVGYRRGEERVRREETEGGEGGGKGED